MTKRARRRHKPLNATAKALSSGLFRPKVEVDRRKAARLIRNAKHRAKLEGA
jgi:hypothetical protein